MSLLELVIASTMLALVLTSISVVLRTSRGAWEAHEADFTRLENLHGTLRHIVREARQAKSVSGISAASNNAGSLSLLMPNGETHVWQHDNANQRVNFGLTTADQLLANQINSLTFSAYKADGTTLTTNPADIRSIKVQATTQLPRETNGLKTASSWVWIRSW